MDCKKILIIVFIVFTIIIALPLSVACIVIGVIQPGNCDYIDQSGLDVGQYLIGLGVASCASCLFFVAFYILLLFDNTMKIGMIGVFVVALVSGLFSLAWFIVGGVILYRGNIDCIRSASATVIFGLVLWCISAFSLLKTCFTSHIRKFDN